MVERVLGKDQVNVRFIVLAPWSASVKAAQPPFKRTSPSASLGRTTKIMKCALSITVGFLWFSQLRAVLDGYVNKRTDFSYREGRGWLDRTFYVRGNPDDLGALANRFNGWASKVERII